MAKGKQVEKPTPLGDRVYASHRKMIGVIAKKKKLSRAKAVRFAIEDAHARVVSEGV